MIRGEAPHLVSLHDGWSVWRWIRLRGAGFPVALLDDLALPAAVTAIDHYLDALDSAATRRDEALAATTALLERAEGVARKSLARTVKRLRTGALPGAVLDAAPAGAEVAEVLDRAMRAARDVDAHRRGVEAVFEADRRRAAGALRRIAASPHFREAVTWQNRRALHNGLANLAHLPVEAVDRDTRKRELAVASYLQRYCAKNDTISFFGPVSWGTFRDDISGATLVPGPSLLARRTVYYEHWCMNAVAQHIAADPQLLPWLAPRRGPTLRIEGTTLYSPIEKQTEVSPVVAQLVTACDGETPAFAIARRLVADPQLGLADEDEVYSLLAALVDEGLISWTLELSPEELDPERTLRAALERVGDPEPRVRALGKLDAIAAARARVAHAAGDPAALDAALGAFEQTFSAMTGLESTRKPGETYGGRTLLYEDCRRDVSFTLGADVVARIGPPLGLLLASARWYTYAIAVRYRQALRDVYESLRQAAGSSVIDFRRFWDRARPLFPGRGAPSIVRDVTAELCARWRDILRIDPSLRRCDRTYRELADHVARVFCAPGPGWPLARYQSPDLLFAASGVDALSGGDYLVVIGEVHTGLNSVLVPVFAKEYPDVEQLVRAREADIAEPCIAPVWSHERSRADMFSLARHDLSFENGHTRSARPRDQVIPESALVIDERAGRVEVCTRDGRYRFDIITFIEHHLIAESHAEFTVVGSAAHSPRITVDGVVFSREKWQLTPDEIRFVHLEMPVERFIAARAWARTMGMPRRIFIKVPDETKPVFVDLESSVLVDNMARMVRKAPWVTISEMLPDIEQTWLVDRERRTYTSELRIVAVDTLAFQ
jgi:Lantibiotic dehydratase, N terminus